jgi:small Trp-rich protein
MYFLIAGLVALVWNYWRIGLVLDSSWWWVMGLFGLAIAWWSFADSSGYTKRKEMEKMDAKKQARLDRQRDALGLRSRSRKR